MATWRWAGDVELGTGAVKFLSGSGDPTGVVTAPVGSLYLRQDGGSGTSIYIKETGVGNTGWIAITTGGTSSDLVVEINGVPNSIQTVLNFTATGLTATDRGSGNVDLSTDATQIPYAGGSITTVGEGLDQALYVDPVITSITNNVLDVELGATLTSVTVSWTLNRPVTILRFTAADSHLTPSIVPVNISPTSLTSKAFTGSYTPSAPIDATWTLEAGDSTSTTLATTKVQFRLKNYWGVSASPTLVSSDVVALENSALASDKNLTFTYNCNETVYPYFAYPLSYGFPTFVTVNGLGFTDYNIDVILVTNVQGFTVNYVVLRFNNIQTGLALEVMWS